LLIVGGTVGPVGVGDAEDAEDAVEVGVSVEALIAPEEVDELAIEVVDVAVRARV
jgi:hypothetical protein